jgi:hypothetical protein
MKITVPNFVTEANIQEAVKRLVTKGVSPDANVLTAVATSIGMLEHLGGAAGIAAITPPSPDTAPLEPTTFLSQEQMEFVTAKAVSRGIDASQFASDFARIAPYMLKLIQSSPKKEISIELPEAH